MVEQRKIDDQRSVFQRVLPPKNALQTKRPVFYSPGEFTGRGSEPHLHKRKVEILRCQENGALSSNLPPKTKKPTGGPVGGESKKWSGHRDLNPGLSAPKADALARLRYAP